MLSYTDLKANLNAIFVKSGQNTGSASHRFLLTIVFWIVVAVALFFGFKTFQ